MVPQGVRLVGSSCAASGPMTTLTEAWAHAGVGEPLVICQQLAAEQELLPGTCRRTAQLQYGQASLSSTARLHLCPACSRDHSCQRFGEDPSSGGHPEGMGSAEKAYVQWFLLIGLRVRSLEAEGWPGQDSHGLMLQMPLPPSE